jgi:lipopolysaccharide exporter
MAATTAPPDGTASDDERPGEHSEQLVSKVRRGAVWSVASTIALRFGTIATTAVVARILDRNDFGVFAVALTALMIVLSFGELGVASCLVRADLDIDLLAPTMVTVSLVTAGMLALVLVEFALPIATALGGRASAAAAAGPIRVMAISALLGGVFAVPNAQLSRDLMQNKLFMSNLVAFVPSTAVLLILAETGSGAMAFAWSRIAGQVVAGAIQYAAVSKRYRPGLARRAMSTLWRFGLPLGGANFVGYVLLNVDYAFVGHLMGAAALGVYVLGFNVASWPVTLLGSMISSVSMPAISRMKSNATTVRNAIRSGARALSVTVAPICALSIAFAHQLVDCIYGHKWAAAAGVLTVLSLYGGISIICMFFSNIIGGLGRSRSLLVVQLIWLAALVPAMAIGVKHDGIDGAASAHVAVILPIVLPCYVFSLKRITHIRLRSLAAAILPPVVAAAAAAVVAVKAAALLGQPLLQLAIGLAVGGLLYAAVTAPQLIGLLSAQQAAKLRLDRVSLAYASFGRAVGLRPHAAEPDYGPDEELDFGDAPTLIQPAFGLTYSAAMKTGLGMPTYSSAINGTIVGAKALDLGVVEKTLELRAGELRALLARGRPGSPGQPDGPAATGLTAGARAPSPAATGLTAGARAPSPAINRIRADAAAPDPGIVQKTLELRAAELRALLASGRARSPHEPRHARSGDRDVKRK